MITGDSHQTNNGAIRNERVDESGKNWKHRKCANPVDNDYNDDNDDDNVLGHNKDYANAVRTVVDGTKERLRRIKGQVSWFLAFLIKYWI